MNSEVTLSMATAAILKLDNATEPAAGMKEFAADLCMDYVRQLLTTPPASGEVVGVQEVSNLLAVIHGDGGHYQHEHGTAKAATDALAKYNAIKQQIAEAAPKQAMGWRPIESAPRDGTRVLLYFAGLDHVEDATITEDGYCLFDGESFNQPPTHWQPLDELPSPPEKAPASPAGGV